MKRTAMQRTTTLKPGTKRLTAKAPMARSTTPMRARKPASAKPKRAARNDGPDYLTMCRGQRCYLLLPGITVHDPSTVVPCHSNQIRHGKGMGLKALHEFTVPGCAACHRELDQGARFTKEEKFALWDDAYRRWEIDRNISYVR